MHEPKVAPLPSVQELLKRGRDYRREVRDLCQKHGNVVFYGCGAIMPGVVESWRAHVDMPVAFCSDRNPDKWGQSFWGARCLTLDELFALKDQSVVFLTLGDFRPVYDQLKAHGFPAVHQIFKYDLAAAEFLARADVGHTQRQLLEGRRSLADERSREVFDAIVRRVLDVDHDVDVMRRVCESDQYFPPDVVRLSAEEHLVDVGAYNGDTVRDFVRRTGGRFARLHAFELDAVNYQAMVANVDRMAERDRIVLHNVGAWDRQCEVTYSIGKSQSSLGEGEGRGRVERLDHALEGERVTMIKMDIEGAEPQALRGAAQLIRTQRPKLAICIYHDFRHLWEIPLYLRSLVPEYQIYLRHHTSLEYETVCYAIPPEGAA